MAILCRMLLKCRQLGSCMFKHGATVVTTKQSILCTVISACFPQPVGGTPCTHLPPLITFGMQSGQWDTLCTVISASFPQPCSGTPCSSQWDTCRMLLKCKQCGSCMFKHGATVVITKQSKQLHRFSVYYIANIALREACF